MQPKQTIAITIAAIVLVIVIGVGSASVFTVPAGHVGVLTLFGKVDPISRLEGLHFKNPLAEIILYDGRQKSHKEQVAVPSQDQLSTQIDVSVQYRIINKMATVIVKETGSIEQMVAVHLVPKLRSLMREQGKSVEKAEHFFLEETQQVIQTNLESGLRDYLAPMGIEVQAVLLRDIQLPPFIMKAIQKKKEREQKVEEQKAELMRFRTEQEQLVASAEAEKRAAQETAETKRILADALAYEIEKINKAIAGSPAYIQLQALEALKAISKDPASKVYFINGDSPMPLPLMHMGEVAPRAK